MGTQEPKTLQEVADYVLTKRCRIAEIAKNLPEERLVSLAHHIDLWWLHEAYRGTRKDGVAGVDRQTAGDYRKNLRENLENLLEQVKSGTYRAPPVRRVYIPKPGGKETRPLGIPTFEDTAPSRYWQD